MNRDRGAVESTNLVISSTSLHPAVDDSQILTLRIENNDQASAVVTVDLYYAPGV